MNMITFRLLNYLTGVFFAFTTVIVLSGAVLFGDEEGDTSAAPPKMVFREGVLVEVDYVSSRITVADAEFVALLQKNQLEVLKVIGGSLSAESLAIINRQKNLRELFLQETMTRDSDLATMVAALPHLQRLTLRRLPHLSDQGIMAMVNELVDQQVPLDVLALIELGITGNSISPLASLKQLRSLDLRFCSEIRGNDLAKLSVLPQLTEFKIGGFGIDDSAWECIASFPALRSLHLDQAAITAGGFEQFLESTTGKKLTALSLSHLTVLGDASLEKIANCSTLKSLSLREIFSFGQFFQALRQPNGMPLPLESISLINCFMTDESMEQLRPFVTLKRLDLTGCSSLTDASWPIIQSFPNLTMLKTQGTSITNY